MLKRRYSRPATPKQTMTGRVCLSLPGPGRKQHYKSERPSSITMTRLRSVPHRSATGTRIFTPNPESPGEPRFAINTGKLTMTNMSKTWSVRISRRCLLESAVCAGGVATIFAMAAIQPAQAAKVSQKVVNYQESPKGAAKCSNCKVFVAPSSCQTVDGTISPNGWCSIYQKA